MLNSALKSKSFGENTVAIKDKWDAGIYSQFIDARTRPAQDLLMAIPHSRDPKVIYDLGCGPGNSTLLLHERWKNAVITGMDSSASMIQKARTDYPFLQFKEEAIEDFAPKEKADVIFANASLQWVGSHETLIPHLLQCLKPRGILAIQIPNNFHCASHQVTIQLLQHHKAWTPLLKNLRYGKLEKPFYEVESYYNLFARCGVSQQALWETTYYQEMLNSGNIFDWVRGTGLRPVLTAMDEKNQEHFRELYLEEIAKHYVTQSNGKLLFPFRRFFMVCARGE